MPQPVPVLKAVSIALCGVFLLDVMGVFIRILSETYPPTQLAVLRNLFGMIPSALVLVTSAAWHAGGRKVTFRQWPLGLWRGLFVTFAQMCFYLALVRLEFATVGTLAYAAPLIVTALSVPLLGERVGPWRWGAVVIGFAGVILVMQPGSDTFTWAALLPIGAALGYGTASVLVRRIDTDVPSPLVNLYSTFSAGIGALVLMLLWHSPVAIATARDMGMIVAMGCCGGMGVLFLIIAYRMVAPSMLAPFEYIGILIAFGLGWAVFDEAPFDRLFPGVILIVGAGLLIIWREQLAKARAAKTEATAARPAAGPAARPTAAGPVP